MSHQWKAGDLAVCVDASAGGSTGIAHLEYRGTYRVERIYVSPRGLIGLVLFGVRNLDRWNRPVGWNADRFRPVLPAELCFTEAMRSLRPKVEA